MGDSVLLGLDIGSNSVGSAWIDLDAQTVDMGVGIFPAGVDETQTKRGAPLNQDRRMKRQQRRSLARRADRKRRLRRLLTERGLLPTDPTALQALFDQNPWYLRRLALSQPLTRHQFGRVLLHLAQRRGAANLHFQEHDQDEEQGKGKDKQEDKDEQKLKAAVERARSQLGGRTFGQFMADLYDQRRAELESKSGVFAHQPIRNRAYRCDPDQQFCADRTMVRDEFDRIWTAQKGLAGPLADLLNASGSDLRQALDDPAGDDVWQHKGLLFGQRRQYWDAGTLGRCDLEPTDQGCPLADMHAQEFRVVESVNNIRIEERGKPPRPLTDQERAAVLAKLRSAKTASVSTIRTALGLNKKAVKEFYTLNIERDPDRKPNTDWFYREIVQGVFGEGAWAVLSPARRESVNRAILKFDPDRPQDADALRSGASDWWGLSEEQADKLQAAWKKRPKPQNRLKLSRRAIQNLLPYMNRPKPLDGCWPTQIEARRLLAEDADAIDQTSGQPVSDLQRARYALGPRPLTRAQRRFRDKHPDLLPPAPTLANPVVRKAVFEVRRHVTAYLRKYGRRPDRVVIEMARGTTQNAVDRNRQLALNRARNALRDAIADQYALNSHTNTQRRKAIDRVLLCRQQRELCPYCDRRLSESAAARNEGVEIDHVVPFSRCGDNGLNNLVLCHAHCNRGKANQTPSEWLSPEAFLELEARIPHFEKPQRSDAAYFTFRDFARKWDNFHREVREGDGWKTSQLADTAYAARQVAVYLQEALYGDEDGSRRRIFFTKGAYTAMLRHDWGLQDDRLGKPRDDHRHHALDAVVIALTDNALLQKLAARAEERELARAGGRELEQDPLLPPEPWNDRDAFRQAVVSRADELIVSHRPVRRKLAGALHQETQYGPASDSQSLYTCRIRSAKIKPGYLSLSARQREALAAGRKPSPKDDPAIAAKSYLVRDLALRLELRACLEKHGLNPDAFTVNEVQALAQQGRIRMASGVPIKSAVCLHRMLAPVIIQGKKRDLATGTKTPDPRPGRRRIYASENNHHIEIRQDDKGRWRGSVITAFQAAARTRRRDPKGIPFPPVDRSDNPDGKFLMSLSVGETLHMLHPQTGVPGYFVLFKIDPDGEMHFTHHWDARPSESRGPGDKREGVHCMPSALKRLGTQQDQPPVKVRIDPLGKPTPMPGD